MSKIDIESIENLRKKLEHEWKMDIYKIATNQFTKNDFTLIVDEINQFQHENLNLECFYFSKY